MLSLLSNYSCGDEGSKFTDTDKIFNDIISGVLNQDDFHMIIRELSVDRWLTGYKMGCEDTDLEYTQQKFDGTTTL